MARKKTTPPTQIDTPEDPAAAKRDLILKYWSNHHLKEPVPMCDLPLDVIVTVMALMSVGTETDKDTIKSANDYYQGLYPDHDNFKDFLISAFNHNAIIVDVDNSRIPDFTDDGKNYYIYKVNYLPNITWGTDIPIETVRSPSKSLDHIHSLFMKGCWYEEWTDQLLYLWEKIALAECIEYANNRASNYNFHQDSVKLDEICKSLLKTFSVSKIHSMISSAFYNAAAFQQTDECTSYRHALNTIPGKITSIASKSPSQIKEWDRINQLPRSEFSLTLFHKILGFERDNGFYDCPATNYSAIAQRRLDEFVDPRGELETSKISLSLLAHSIADNMVMLQYRTDIGLNEASSLEVRAKITALMDLWMLVSEIPIKDVPAIVEALGALSQSFSEQGFDFVPTGYQWE
ncbi:hypothetical protein [Methylophilus sp. QUAN]|uniref:hypothetical protein n=1 Tax=Methylophilus sp. QUAN TaxID=2781020 RepID=UPI00188FF2FC|nr:hypothetical protein [Methylophilus sp. QUAN]MBF4991866.1 hypothetical protein [Methylophilus sp. QUAN]